MSTCCIGTSWVVYLDNSYSCIIIKEHQWCFLNYVYLLQLILRFIAPSVDYLKVFCYDHFKIIPNKWQFKAKVIMKLYLCKSMQASQKISLFVTVFSYKSCGLGEFGIKFNKELTGLTKMRSFLVLKNFTFSLNNLAIISFYIRFFFVTIIG